MAIVGQFHSDTSVWSSDDCMKIRVTNSKTGVLFYSESLKNCTCTRRGIQCFDDSFWSRGIKISGDHSGLPSNWTGFHSHHIMRNLSTALHREHGRLWAAAFAAKCGVIDRNLPQYFIEACDCSSRSNSVAFVHSYMHNLLLSTGHCGYLENLFGATSRTCTWMGSLIGPNLGVLLVGH